MTTFPTTMTAIAWFAVCMAAAWAATRMLIPLLQRWGRVDRPNERSSHVAPVLRGGGLAVVAVLIVPVAVHSWLLAGRAPLPPLLMLVAFLGLAAISWRDDRKSLPVRVRLAAQIAAIVLGFAALPASGLVFQGLLPPALDHALVAIGWIWFINLYNFMDGIDGISGVETASIGAGLAVVAAFSVSAPALSPLGMAIAGTACGFLIWNWTPAKLFLGDVGSIPLGFLIGFALLVLAAGGQPVPALILPLYYVVDATSTLLLRAWRGEKVWQAHRSHAYQVAALATSHPWVVRRILALNAALVVLAVIATQQTSALALAACLIGAIALAAGLTLKFRRVAVTG